MLGRLPELRSPGQGLLSERDSNLLWVWTPPGPLTPKGGCPHGDERARPDRTAPSLSSAAPQRLYHATLAQLKGSLVPRRAQTCCDNVHGCCRIYCTNATKRVGSRASFGRTSEAHPTIVRQSRRTGNQDNRGRIPGRVSERPRRTALRCRHSTDDA